MPPLRALNIEMIRTCAIIKNLSYDNLVKQNIIPDLMPLINQFHAAIATKRYSPFVYKADDAFAFFGMFMDYAIRAGLRINLTQPVELGVDPSVPFIQTLPDDKMLNIMEQLSLYETSKNINDTTHASHILTSTLFNRDPFTHGDIQSYVPTMVNIIKEIVAKWNTYISYLGGTVKFNTEYSYKTFAGHPDIVIGDTTVLDIKTTGSFPKMAKISCLQVLAYYALMKPTHPNIQYVGFLLPMQRDIILCNLGTWDPSRYLELLASESSKLSNLETTIYIEVDDDGQIDMDRLTTQLNTMNVSPDDMITIQNAIGNPLDHNATGTPLIKGLPNNKMICPTMTLGRLMHKYSIGYHLLKGKGISTSLRECATHAPDFPCQMFLRNTRSGKQNVATPQDAMSIAQLIKDSGLKYFTHAAYVINLCANANDNGDYWAQRYLNEDLTLTAAMGGRGVVVHTGARKHLPVDEATYIMEYMVRTALSYATEHCPLLLETPCGEGTEIVTKIEELGSFFFRFTPEERKKLGICVDICHVHASGYDPLEYLQHWEKHCQTPIRLIHFNDSMGEQGCCVDRHAAPGSGHIGMEKMTAVAEWCHTRNIPMIRE